jgi:predicted GNAT family N-acyltransferase
LIYTNPNYRGQKLCQNNIKYIIELCSEYIKKYNLEVDANNISALTCYIKIGFKKVGEEIYNGKLEYLLELNI